MRMSNERKKAVENLTPGLPPAKVDATTRSYAVGFGKPPKAGQFQKGQFRKS